MDLNDDKVIENLRDMVLYQVGQWRGNEREYYFEPELSLMKAWDMYMHFKGCSHRLIEMRNDYILCALCGKRFNNIEEIPAE